MRKHGQFFNSLKQVEKRLKLENNHQPPLNTTVPPPPPPPLQTNTQYSDSLCSPMYILDEPLSNSSNTLQETPQQFISQENHNADNLEKSPDGNCNASDEIGLLMEQLGLSDSKSSNMMGRFGLGCDDVFYERIVGVKGPKNEKEVERMEGWIKCLLNGGGGEVKEPFKLVHLLLAKAAFVHSGDDGFGGFECPSTVSEFLRNDPPVVD